MDLVEIATWSEVPDRTPIGVTVEGIDLVIVRRGDEHSVLYGRCLHRGALLADGTIAGRRPHLRPPRLGLPHRLRRERVQQRRGAREVHQRRRGRRPLRRPRPRSCTSRCSHPQPFDPDVYQGYYHDPHMVPEEPFVDATSTSWPRTGSPRPATTVRSARWACRATQLPKWDDIQFVTAQLARLPLLDDEPVGTEVCIGPNADKPLWLDIPLFVSDMSFGALSQEAKTALARGAELAGTGICSGEGGMLPEEQAENSRYFYELASARFGWTFDVLKKVQAFHFKGGQGAKTGTGGHLPGDKVVGKIAEVRGLARGHARDLAAAFPDWDVARRLPAVRRRGPRAVGRHPDRLQAVGPAHRGRPRRRARDRRRLRDPRRSRRRHRRGAAAVPRQHLGADDPRARARPRAPRPARPTRRHARHHRRAAPRARLREGARARRRRGRGRELGDPGHRLPRHARVPHQQLPGRHRHPEAAPPRPAPGRRGRAAARPVPARHRRADAGARPGVRPRAPARVLARRPHHLRPRHGRTSPASPTEACR